MLHLIFTDCLSACRKRKSKYAHIITETYSVASNKLPNLDAMETSLHVLHVHLSTTPTVCMIRIPITGGKEYIERMETS